MIPMRTEPNLPVTAFLTLVALFSAVTGTAQMFSVTQAGTRQENTSAVSIMAGYEPSQLVYKGAPLTRGERDFSFSNAIYRLVYDAEDIQLRLGTGQNIGAYNGSLFTIGATLMQAFQVAGPKRFQLQATTGFETDFLRIREGGSNAELVYSSLSLAFGGQLVVRPFSSLNVTAGISRSVGFQTRDFGLDGGRMLTLQIPVRIRFTNLLGGRGLSFGVNYRKVDLDSSGRNLPNAVKINYDLSSILYTVGLNF